MSSTLNDEEMPHHRRVNLNKILKTSLPPTDFLFILRRGDGG